MSNDPCPICRQPIEDYPGSCACGKPTPPTLEADAVREWTIVNDSEYDFHVIGPTLKRGTETRVIERSSYERVVAELAASEREVKVLKNMVKKTCESAEEQLNNSVHYQVELSKERARSAKLVSALNRIEAICSTTSEVGGIARDAIREWEGGE